MTDVVEIAKERRVKLVAEIAELDDFVSMAKCPASAPMRRIGHIEQGRISGSS
jgi:hypothetical protein